MSGILVGIFVVVVVNLLYVSGVIEGIKRDQKKEACHCNGGHKAIRG
jgi:hypothetical protein